MEYQNALELAKLLEEREGKDLAEDYLQSLSSNDDERTESFSTDYFDEQIAILEILSQYSG